MMQKKIDVVAACISKESQILLAQRRADDHFPNLWEFPGGKIEPGETREQALKREIKEELNLDIKVGNLIGIFSDEIPSLKIKVYLYKVDIFKGTVKALESQDWVFVGIRNMNKLNLAPVDKKIYSYLCRTKEL